MNTNLRIKDGSCFLVFAFEIGERVHIELAREKVKAKQQSAQFQERRSQAPFFGFDPPPLKVVYPLEGNFGVGDYKINPLIEITLWSFGVASVKFELPLAEKSIGLEDLVALGAAIEEDQLLEMEALKQVRAFGAEIRGAIEDPCEPTVTEDYTMYSIRTLAPETGKAPAPESTEAPAAKPATVTAKELLETERSTLARILRAEKGTLSDQVQADATRHIFSWADDLTVVDWGAAFIYGTDNGDIIKLLEFELVILLELRYLDELLDQQCEEAAELFLSLERQATEKSRLKRWGYKARGSALGQLLLGDKTEEASRRIAGLTVDAIRNISAATNAINVLGDPTLDSLHSLAAERFRLTVQSDGIERKLGHLDNVYQKIETQRHGQKSLFLEISVVLLIVLEVILALFVH